MENERTGGMAGENQILQKEKKENSTAVTTAQIFRGLVINPNGVVTLPAVISSKSRRNAKSSHVDRSS